MANKRPGRLGRIGQRLKRSLRRFGAAAPLPSLAAVAIVLAYPRFNLFFLALVGLIPLMVAVEGRSPGSAFRRGLWTGFLVNVGGFYWIVGLIMSFGGMPWPIGVLLLALLALQQGLTFGIAAWIATHARKQGAGRVLAWVPAFVAAETVNPLIFPWRLGNSQYNHIPFVQSADIGGVFLITAFVVAINAAGLDVLCWLRARRAATGSSGTTPAPRGPALPRAAIVVLAVVAANYAYGALRMNAVDRRTADAETVRIGMVEADIAIEDKWDPALYADNLLRHQRLAAELDAAGAELIIWPESAFEQERFIQAIGDYPDAAAARENARMSSILREDVQWIPTSNAPLVADPYVDLQQGTRLIDRSVPQRGFRTPLLFGTTLTRPLSAEESRALAPYASGRRSVQNYNSVLLLEDDGRVLGRAHKIVLMPFSETIHGGQWLYDTFGFSIYAAIPSAGDFGKGAAPTVLELPARAAVSGEGDRPSVRLGILNCYEDIMPGFNRRIARNSPDLLVNLTNDAWFGQTNEPWQHMGLATLRSVELRTFMLRATNTGVSAVIDANGRILENTDTRDAETILFDTPLLEARRTVYVRCGNWVGILASLWCGFILVRALRIRRRETAQVSATASID